MLRNSLNLLMRNRKLTSNHHQQQLRGMEEFFQANSQYKNPHLSKENDETKQQKKNNKKKIKAGGEWRAWMLRQKSTDDLHKLWYVLLKERNCLLTEQQECRSKLAPFPDPSRKKKVQKSMARIKHVLHERSQVYQHNQQVLKEREEAVGQTQ